MSTCPNCQHPWFWHDAKGCGFTGPERFACVCTRTLGRVVTDPLAPSSSRALRPADSAEQEVREP